MSTAYPSAPAGRPSRGAAMLAVLAAAAVSAALLLWALDNPVFAAAFFAGVLALGLPLLFVGPRAAAVAEPVERGADLGLVRAGLEASPDAVAVTDSSGALLAANSRYESWFGIRPPLDLPFGDALRATLASASREGRAEASELESGDHRLTAFIRSAGHGDDALIWRFVRGGEKDAAAEARDLLGGEVGNRIAQAGLMAALTAADGRILEANAAFQARAGGEAEVPPGTPLVDLLVMSEQHQFHFAREGKAGGALRILQVPLAEEEGGPSLFLLLDELGGVGGDSAHNINALLEILPLGLALADRDGRFVYLNAAFRRAAGVSRTAMPTWPSDLVVDEDKAAVADSIRRFARGASLSGDVAVRLKAKPDDPVALTVAGARGLGEAAVLLSLKDNSEEDRLKRQVAQATKMQAVGQLAGGVAHDFNNILTAIIGHCDLMLMRHAPGDSDYDDIQQIRSNSNRAASLTRQL
ncbi:MAG TPA: PAS domain-containing protein, partial [Allosphingosinicella sp.]